MKKPITDSDINQWRPLVHHVVNRLFAWAFTGDARHGRMRPYDKEDLIQVGLIAVWHALEEFDVDRGATFKTYAFNSVHNAIRRFLNSKKNVIGSNVALLSEVRTAELIKVSALVDKRYQLYLRNREAQKLIREYRRIIKAIVSPCEYRVMLLRDRGMTYEEIGKNLDPPRTHETARKYHHSFLAKVESHFGTEIEDDAKTL